MNDFGKTKFEVFPNTTVASFENIPEFFAITITKQGFKPDLYGFKKNGNVIEYGPIVFNGTDVEFLETDVVYLNSRSSKIISRTNDHNDNIEQVAVSEDTCRLILDNNDLYIKPPVFEEFSKEMDLRIVNVMNNEILYEDNVASGSKTSISDLKSGFYIACLYSDNEMIDIIKFKK